ncbi:hypothetical protein H4W19_17605 [Pseudoxanthomonas mexicana]|uniref:Uncharacterized protein n=1 Tax=Pseudoxanthomonas mexicana TaxID=128785 RepID=A0ABX6RAA3_PSEMX|nr:hypothetical protein [Pseudoxanthomonas mexicana]QLQ26943.1 MAG: hypothetical protein HZT39_00335 [Pseudoxanthomonas sp.]QND80102.1 hypothetical protein H4W19_17605 [Pseudoxanthomonas mexicana]
MSAVDLTREDDLPGLNLWPKTLFFKGFMWQAAPVHRDDRLRDRAVSAANDPRKVEARAADAGPD